MTNADSQHDWHSESPAAVMADVVRAAEHAARGDADSAAVVTADSTADPALLCVAAVRTVAGLIAGRYADAWLDKLRQDAHQLAADTHAPDEQVRLSLTAIALAEACARGDAERCDELMSLGEFGDRDLAHAAACLAGHLVAYRAGDQTAEVFTRLRQRYGVGGVS